MAASAASTIATAIMTTVRREDVMPMGGGSPDPGARRDPDRRDPDPRDPDPRDPDPRDPALVARVRGRPAGDGQAPGRPEVGEVGEVAEADG
jgi:hypothetical protein